MSASKSFSKYFQTDPDTGVCLNYEQFVRAVVEMLDALRRIGIQKGEVIGTLCGNSTEFIIFCLAALGLGSAVLPLNPAYTSSQQFLNV